MSTNLDFNSSKEFRNKILSRTLPVHNGPMSQTADNYRINQSTDFSNIDQPPVDANRTEDLTNIAKVNTYKPDFYFIREDLNTLPRKANLKLYPYFTPTKHSIIGILTQDNISYESELMKFANWYIKENPEGPIYARLQQNLETSTIGRVRLIDALEGNLSTAVNIVTGKEPLIEANNKITTAKTLPGKGIDFLQTVAGVEFPWTEIPGDYLTNPENPVVNRPEAKTKLGDFNRDLFGSLGSMLGIQRRPLISQKPSDLFIEYMGSGQKQMLFDNLSYSKYAPNYTVNARSQNSSKVFNFVDSIGQNINKFFGADAPDTVAYIGDDRGDDVKFAMYDFNGRPVRSSYYLSLMFDPIQARLFQREKNISENGIIGGKLTWISSKSKNKLGENNKEWSEQKTGFNETTSTNFKFRADSILGITQELLESMPTNGGEMRSHVANVIDQTSRLFKDGDVVMSRGSNIKYVDKYGEETGVEYCRVWTKDRSYMNYSDTMKRTGNIRKFDSSVLVKPWDISISPTYDEKNDKFQAKKYMFSIENLAWKTSNIPGYTYNDLPYCERGSNGGRVMWFPPYDIKITENNTAKWDSNVFLGRPEPIYTYQSTERYGTLNFMMIVDHPSVLNLLVRDYFKDMSDEESENYINAFFAGCKDVDLYDLIIKYHTLTPDETDLIIDYINKSKDKETIKDHDDSIPDIEQVEPPIKPPGVVKKLDVILKYLNDEPKNTIDKKSSPYPYDDAYNYMISNGVKGNYIARLENEMSRVITGFTPTTDYTENHRNHDLELLIGTSNISEINLDQSIQTQLNQLEGIFDNAEYSYNSFITSIIELRDDILNDVVTEAKIHLLSSTSEVADDNYNVNLSLRRTHSVLKSILKIISIIPLSTEDDKWNKINNETSIDIEYTFKELGFNDKEGKIIITTRSEGENFRLQENVKCSDYYFVNKIFKVVAPVSFHCRQTQVILNYTKTTKSEENSVENEKDYQLMIKKNETSPYSKTQQNRSKPPLDTMKHLIMKVLSECFYFKKLEETDPIVFGSLKERLKYFHPGFHSTTPEGLNSRLTFLHQCIRPGDTIPIKGVNSTLDLRARNTSFGPPPICVLRIGDFYNTKIVITDYNIEFQETTWDLNPEGIGIQPMLAKVSLQIKFIGGQGLEKPVKWLQNALSSNFYANTEMYDPRSITTTQKIDGKSYDEFTKEFIEKLNDPKNKPPKYIGTKEPDKITTEKYIGDQSNNVLSYNSIVDKIFTNTENYVMSYENQYNRIIPYYGKNVSSILLSPKYRKNYIYNVFTPTSQTQVELLGLYEKGKDLFVLASMFEEKMNNTLDTIDILKMFGFNKDLPENSLYLAEKYVKEYLVIFFNDTVESIINDGNLINLETSRNLLIESLDNANFIVKYGYDAKLDKTKTKATEGSLSGFTKNMLYDVYSSCIDYLSKNSNKFNEDLEININYGNPMEKISEYDFTNIMENLLYKVKSTEFISKTFGRDKTVFNESLTSKLTKRYEKFVKLEDDKKFKSYKFQQKPNSNEIKFTIGTETEITNTNIITELTNLNTDNFEPKNELNYYSKK